MSNIDPEFAQIVKKLKDVVDQTNTEANDPNNESAIATQMGFAIELRHWLEEYAPKYNFSADI